MKLRDLRSKIEALKKRLDEYKNANDLRKELEAVGVPLLKEQEEFLKNYQTALLALDKEYEDIKNNFLALEKNAKEANEKKLIPSKGDGIKVDVNQVEEIALDNDILSELKKTSTSDFDETNVPDLVEIIKFEDSLKKLDDLYKKFFITSTDARKKLNHVEVKETITQQQTPKNLKNRLLQEFNNQIPTRLAALHQEYEKAYKNLQNEDIDIANFLTTAELDGQPILLEPFFNKVDTLRSHQYDLTTLYSNIQIERNKALREQNGDQPILSNNKSEKITLTTHDFSDSFLKKYAQPLENLVHIFSGSFNLEWVNAQVIAIGRDKLDEHGIGSEFYKDHARSDCSFNGETLNYVYNRQKTQSYLETFINLYLEEKGFDETAKNNAKPNLRGLLSIVAGQGTFASILNNLLGTFTLNLYGDNNAPVDCYIYWRNLLLHQTQISIKDGKLHVESFYVPKTPTKTLGSDDKDYAGDLFDDLLAHRISFDIDLNIDHNNQPIFTIDDFSIDLTINKPNAVLDHKQILIKESNLKNPTALKLEHLDILRPHLDNIAKFCGHVSLEKFIYSKDIVSKNEIERRRDATDTANTKIFNHYFIIEITENPIERNFLETLHKACYEKHESKEKLITHIFNFLDQEFPKLSHSDKKRYIHLLKIAEDLGASSQKIVDFLSQQRRSNDLLLEGAKISKHIYQELVKPKGNFTSFIRSIRERLPNWFFGIHPRPVFNETIILKKVLANVDNLMAFKALFISNNTFSNDFFKNFENSIKQFSEEERKAYINQLLTKGDIEVIQAIRNKIPTLFTQHTFNSFDDSIESVRERLEMIILASSNNPTEVMNRFEKHFINQLWQDLYELTYKETDDPMNNLTQFSGLHDIKTLLDANFWLKEEPLYLKLHDSVEEALKISVKALQAEANIDKAITDVEEIFKTANQLINEAHQSKLLSEPEAQNKPPTSNPSNS